MYMESAKSKALLFVSSFIYALGAYFLIIRYALDSFRPSPHPEIYLPVLRDRLHPEIDIPLYTWGILFLIVVGYGLHLFLHYLLRSQISEILSTLAGAIFRISCLSVFVLWGALVYFPSLPLLHTSLIYLFVPTAITAFFIAIPKKLVGFIRKFLAIFDFTIITGAVLCFVLFFRNIFFTQYFQSSAFVPSMQKEGYVYFQGFSWKEFLFVAIGFIPIVFIYMNPLKKLLYFSSFKLIRLVLDGIVLAGILFSISIVVPWDARNWVGIADFGPIIGIINDVLGGKTILVNSYSQYGLLMPYVASLIFNIVPLTYFTFFQLLYLLTIIGYVLIYIALRIWFKSYMIPTVWVILAVQHHYLSQLTNIHFLPMLTFIRFGWWIILFLFFVVKDRIKNKEIQLIIELFLVSIGVFWAFDVGAYIFFSYGAYCVIRALVIYSSLQEKVYAALRSLFLFCVTLAVMFLVITFFSWLRSGQYPLWNTYFLHTTLFADGFGLTKLPVVGSYYIVFSLYIGVMLSIIYALFVDVGLTQRNKIELPVVGFLTVYTLFQSLYYVGQSVPGNLHVLILPSLILFCWVLYRIRPHFANGTAIYLSASEHVALKLVGFIVILSFFILTTVSLLNAIGAYKRRGPVAYFPTEEFLDDRYRQSINWLNSYLSTIPPHQRKITLISEQDWVFLLETKSTNIIDSGNNYYFILESQYQLLCQQLTNRNPHKVFIQNDPGWGWTDILRDCARKRYHYVENIGFLDRWERSEGIIQ